MKCIICNGLLKQKLIEQSEFGVSLGRYNALVCDKCHEIFFDGDTVSKIQKKSKELGLFGLTKKIC